jgi:hypothetical protein
MLNFNPVEKRKFNLNKRETAAAVTPIKKFKKLFITPKSITYLTAILITSQFLFNE